MNSPSGASGTPPGGRQFPVPGVPAHGPVAPGGAGRGVAESGTAITAGAYVALLLVGAVQGLIGTFQYSRGPGLLVPILFDALILATCLLGSWGMRTALGGVLPAIGWILVTLLLSSASAGGSVIVTATHAGEWFLFGGALCAAAGAVWAFARWSRASRDRRAARQRF